MSSTTLTGVMQTLSSKIDDLTKLRSEESVRYQSEYTSVAQEQARMEISHLINAIEPHEAHRHIDIMKMCLHEDHLLPSAEAPGTLLLRSTGVLYYHFKMCQPGPSYIEQLKWEPNLPRVSETNMWEISNCNRVTINFLLPSLKNFLTLGAKVGNLEMNMRQWWYCVFLHLSDVERSMFWGGEMPYILIDLGYIDQTSAYFIKSWKHILTGDSVQLAVKTVEIARNFPLSLKQLVRKRIRSRMREGHVLEDCYRLPLPRSLQDYVSLRFLEAPIRRWIMGREPSSAVDYELHDIKWEVLQRYNIST